MNDSDAPEKENVPELFGSMVFNDAQMRRRLPPQIYESLRGTIRSGGTPDAAAAKAVAEAMKDWAIERGATHYTHWFQPMTGVTAEKHDSFICPQPDGGVIMDFSEKELIRGEPDASNFPSGGLRATFEARGYTAWDPTSYAFVKDDSLCIPTVFCSYGGEVLDKKTPLLRSMDLIGEKALRILRLFGDKRTRWVCPTCGPEQEYFLIDRELFLKRKDLIFTGRTLFGACPPKGQELDDHYFGAIRPRVMRFMKELNRELWKLGIFAKTEHNEVAPSQHELAPVFSTVNIATDHNQLTMEIMKRVAEKHGMACLLHEKPFAGVNGSGKHNNWSLATDSGENLFDPGKRPAENRRFLLLLCSVIRAVDDYQDLLRASAAGAGNDLRLGADEAPPAIMSMFLGSHLTRILEAAALGARFGETGMPEMNTGVHSLPAFRRDTADRNRTSPFAFTGNKFEFRMPGSSLSIAGPNTVINTAVADALDVFAGRLEGASDLGAEVTAIIRDTMESHRRIIFNGNNYSEEWVKEARRRGLFNLRTAADALPRLTDEKNVSLFTRHRIFTESEIRSRCEIQLESYCKINTIEALTMIQMARRDIFPAVTAYTGALCEAAAAKQAAGLSSASDGISFTAVQLSGLSARIYRAAGALEDALEKAKRIPEYGKRSEAFRDCVIPLMTELRAAADEAETLTGSGYWPYPVYGDLLYSV